MFWGIKIKPNKRYIQLAEKPFHMSQAAIDISTGDEDPCQVMVVVDGEKFLVCTLQKDENIQVPLDLHFKSGVAVSFLTNGKCNVFLTGYFNPGFDTQKIKRKLENSKEKARSEQKKEKKAKADSEVKDEAHWQKIPDGEDLDSGHHSRGGSSKVNTVKTPVSDEEEEASTALGKSQKPPLKKVQKRSKESQVSGVDKPKKEAEGEQQQPAKKKKPEAKKEAQRDGQVENKVKKTLRRRVPINNLKLGDGPAAKPGKYVMKEAEGEQQQTAKKKKPEAKKEAQRDGQVEKNEKKTLRRRVTINNLKGRNGPAAKPGKYVMKEAEGEQQQKAKEKKPEAKKEAERDGQVEKKEKKTLRRRVTINNLKGRNGSAAKPGKYVMKST